MRPLLRAFLKTSRANAAIEFALIVPVMLVFMAGIVELGRAFQVYSAVNRLATRYAIAWADCSDDPVGTCGTEIAMYTNANAIKNFVPQLTNPVTLNMVQVQMVGTTPTIMYPTTGGTLSPAETTALQNTLVSGQIGVVVTVKYAHTLVFFSKLAQQAMPSLVNKLSITYTVAQLRS